MCSAKVIDFEDINATVTPPFEFRPGGLLELFGGNLNRGVGRFDIVTNIGEQTKPSEFGQHSLDPYFIQEDTTPFRFDLGIGTSERTAFFANTVSITVGDYGEDEDKIVLQAFSNTDVLLGETTATLPAGGTDFTSTTLSVTSKFGEQISYIKFIGGSDKFPNSVFYDNITLTYVPTENELTTSNPYWNYDPGNVGVAVANQIIADALNGRGKHFLDELATNDNPWRNAANAFENAIGGLADEAYTNFVEAFKTSLRDTAVEVGKDIIEDKGLPFKIGIAAGYLIPNVLEISKTTGKPPTNLEVITAAGLRTFGDSIMPGIGGKALEYLVFPSHNPQQQTNTSVQNEFSFSAEALSLNNEPITTLESDTIEGSTTNDELLGSVEDDYLFGEAGNDTLEGSEGWDVVIGGAGDDLLTGGDGADMLNGNGETFTVGEVDTFTGGVGVDIFVLGDPGRSYYDDQKATTSGTGDYALITDFDINQDFIVLKGDFSDYIFEANEAGTGVSIFLDNDGKTGFSPTDELIAQVEGVTELSPIDLMFI